MDADNRMHFRFKEYDFYMRFVFFDTRHMHSYYSKFTNGFLWPLVHLTRSPEKPDVRGILALSTSGASRVLKEKGFGEENGIVYINPMKTKEAAGRIFRALEGEKRLSERLVDDVERERRVDEWAEKNIEAILR